MRKFDNLYKPKHIYHITMPPPIENNDMSDTESFKAMLEEEQDEKRDEIMALVDEKLWEIMKVIHWDDSSNDEDECKMGDLWQKFFNDVNCYVFSKKYDVE